MGFTTGYGLGQFALGWLCSFAVVDEMFRFGGVSIFKGGLKSRIAAPRNAFGETLDGAFGFVFGACLAHCCCDD